MRTKFSLFGILALMFCLSFLTPPVLAQESINALTPEEFLQLVERKGLKGGQVLEGGVIQLDIHGNSLMISVSDGVLMALDGTPKGNANLELVNEWNKEHSILARTYVEDDDLVFRANLRLAPGVSSDYILYYLASIAAEQADWLKTFSR